MTTIEDYLLIWRIKRGDRGALDQLVAKYYEVIYQFCWRRSGGQQNFAEEVCQETFLKLIQVLPQYQFTGKFRSFIFTIAVNTYNNLYKKKTPLLLEHLPEESTGEDALDQALTKEQAQVVKDALAQLPAMQKEALILRYYHDFKTKEIAEITGVSVATAQSRIQQGQSKLKKYLKGVLS